MNLFDLGVRTGKKLKDKGKSEWARTQILLLTAGKQDINKAREFSINCATATQSRVPVFTEEQWALFQEYLVGINNGLYE